MMASISSLLNGDLSIWGVIAMPVGVAICFGPALIVWLKTEAKGEEKPEPGRTRGPDSEQRSKADSP